MMFWTIFATFIATSLVWILFMLYVVNLSQRKEISELRAKILKGEKTDA